ncbi:MAG: hypothetical protein KDC24_11690 [Saprospiraceae bacterium]|nr:hypothetical protein [Saprospiraceae bacterium]
MAIRHWIYLLMFLTIPLGFWLGSLLPFASDVSTNNPASNADIEAYQHFIEKLGNDTSTVESIMVMEKKSGWKTLEDFKKLDTLTQFWEDKNGIAKALSISNLPYPTPGLLSPVTVPFLDLNHPERFSNRMESIRLYPDIFEKFLSKDLTHALVFLYGNKGIDSLSAAEMSGLDILQPDITPHFIQYDLIKKEIETTMEKDTFFLAGISLVLILLGFYFFSHSLSGLGLISLAVLFNIALTFIAMYLLGMQFTVHMVTIPAIIIVLSFTDIMHMLYHQSVEANRSSDEMDMQQKILDSVKVPLLLTSVTNLVGFSIFLAFSNNIHLQNFSLAAILGVVFAYLCSRFLIIRLMTPGFVFIQKKDFDRLYSIHQKLGDAFSARKGIVLAVFSLLVIVPGWFVFNHFNIDSSDQDFKLTNSGVNKGAEILQKEFFGSKQAEILIRVSKNDVWELGNFKKIAALEKDIDTIFQPLFINSPVVMAKRYNRYIHYGKPEDYTIPEDLQTSFLNEVRKNQLSLGAYGILDTTSTNARILFGFGNMNLSQARKAYAMLHQKIESLNQDEAIFQLSGMTYLSDEATYRFSRKILFGLLASILVGSLLVFFFLKSFRKSLGVLLVNLLPMILALGLLEWWEIPVSPLSLFFLSILLGISVDDSIYLIMQYREGEEKVHVIPVFITSIVLGLGFLSLAFSSFEWIQPFGWIFVMGICLAYILDLFVLPIFLNRKAIFGADG